LFYSENQENEIMMKVIQQSNMMRKSRSKCFTGKSTKEKNVRSVSGIKYDEKITIEMFHSKSQHKRRRIEVVPQSNMMRKSISKWFQD
jgi:hypothetical protein